jgi:hypothetical protein
MKKFALSTLEPSLGLRAPPFTRPTSDSKLQGCAGARALDRMRTSHALE